MQNAQQIVERFKINCFLRKLICCLDNTHQIIICQGQFSKLVQFKLVQPIELSFLLAFLRHFLAMIFEFI